jgi:predicted GH43/DUF377 family glycosyl hydrolase
MLIPDPSGQPAVAIVHRPLFPGTRPEEKARLSAPGVMDPDRECLWMSYCPVREKEQTPAVGTFCTHHHLACPEAEWDQLKIGGGPPPVMCRHGWLFLYHGVHEIPHPDRESGKLCYSAGAMILSREQPNEIIYRSTKPVLVPKAALELHGTVPAVVFPTGIDRRDDLGTPDRFDVYYGMADYRIGVARLDVPTVLSRDAAVAGS